jgi:Spy/CpxP family protein refolding chaperone
MTFTGRTGTALLAALIVSLCVNLLLGGVMIGGRLHHDGPWWRSVPEEAQPIMRQVFESHKAEFDAHRDAVRQARQKVADLLKAEPIDQAALDQAMAELSEQSQSIRQLGNTMMVEVAKQLSPDLRAQVADSWAKDRFRRRSESN